MKPRGLLWKLLPLLWLAFVMRLWRLGTGSLWYDEGYSVYLGAHLPLGEALDLTVRDIVPPLYYLLLRIWSPLAGTSEYALRFLSVLLGVLAVALIARIGRHLVGFFDSSSGTTEADMGGVLSGALAAIAPVLIWLSQDARMYGPLVTWSLLATWGLLRAISKSATPRSRRRGWALFAGAGLAALYTHTISAFWLIGQVAFGALVIWRERRQRERVIEALIALLLMCLGYLPWVIVALVSFQTNAGYWPGYLPPSFLWRTAWQTFVGGQQLSLALADLAAVWFGVGALLSWLILLLKRPRVAVYLTCYLAIPLLAMGIAFQRTPKLAPRYPTAMAPALFLILAVGTVLAFYTSRVTRYASLLTLLGVIVISLRADANLYLDPDYGKDDWRAAANYIQAHQRLDEAVLLISGHAFPVFAYYYGWNGWSPLPDDVQLDINHVLNYPVTAPQLNQILSKASGVWLVLWQEEVVDPTGLIPALLSDLGRELPTPEFRGSSAGDRLRLQHFEFRTPVQLPDELPVQHMLNQTVAPGLTILGYSAPTEASPADAEISLRAFWQTEEAQQGAHAVSLRLSDRLGQEWARRDSLLAGPYFSERWPLATPVMGHYTVTLPSGAPPGVYEPTLMVYRGEETFETLHLPALAITRPLSISSPSTLGLPSPPPGLAEEIGDGGSQLSLVGVGFDQGTATPCQNWSLSLAWRAEIRPSQDYHVHLSAGDDHVETPLAVDYPTSRWQLGDVWRTRHQLPINCRALDGTVPVVAQLLNVDGQPEGARLNLGSLTVVAGRQFTLPTDLTNVLDVQLPDVGTLVGYRLEGERVRPGENLQVTLYWRAGGETDQNYSVFVHLESDRVWAQHDGWPVNGAKPTSTWAQGEVIVDHHIISLSKDVAPGSYRLLAGMYDAAAVRNLTAIAANGDLVDGGRILLQPVTVLP